MTQLRAHYDSLDNEELLGIARNDLTEEAREVLKEVLAKRGVPVDAVVAAREESVRDEIAQVEAGKRIASRRARLLAFVIDVGGIPLFLVVVLLPLRLASTALYEGVVICVWLVYFLFRDSVPGLGIGKRLLGIRVVQIDSGRTCSRANSVWRNITHLFFGLDAIFILGRRRMRLGDLAGGTIVVKSRAAQSDA